MTAEAERLRKVRDLFDRLVDEPPDARAAAVARLAPDDKDLAREVLALLESHDRDGAWLEDGPGALLAGGRNDAADDWTGRRIGPYRVTREVGRGGMGAVYEAARDDAEYEKRVAIKLIRSGMDSDAIVRRFRRERQILAALDHPNIARLLDGAVMSDGRPYLVMEFVEGQPIDAYCDTNCLDVRRRIELFLLVCDAVDHAHRNMVVHRDLKPGNVLVTADGVPKLLDFGIAKLVTPDIDAGASTMTAVGLRFFTPEYASPEQIRDEPVSARSDVYSLGVILYELLSGNQPFHLDGRSAAAIEKILTTDPGRPSTVVTDAAARQRSESDATRLRRRLAGELDNIVLMALRKESARRYTSVAQFAEDLRRWLDGRPVIATRDTPTYRLRKFVRRHRVGVAAGAIVVLSLLVGAGVAIWQARAAREAARRAEIERAQAEQVTAFVTGIIGSADPSWYSPGEKVGPTTTVLEAIQRAARRVGTDLQGQPEVEATIRRTIGNTYQALGFPDSAEPQLTAALSLRRRVRPAPSMDLALDLRDLGRVRYRKGAFASAESLFRAAIAVHAAIGDDTSDAFDESESDLATAITPLGKLAEAESLQMASLALARRRLGNVHPGIANALSNLAALRSARGDMPSAEHYLRQALDIYAQLHDREYIEHGTALFNLGFVLKWQGKYPEADSALRAARSLFIRTGTQHPWEGYTLVELAHVHYLSGRSVLAESEIRSARAALLAGGVSVTHPEYLRTFTVEGQILTSLGRAHEGEAMLRAALPGGRVSRAPPSPGTAEVLSALGRTLAVEGKLAEAGKLLAQSHAEFLRAFGPNDSRTRWAARADSAFLAQRRTGRISGLPR